MRTRGRAGGRQRAREIPALLFALIWLLGYEVVPLVHVALHAQLAPHTHGESAGGHCHGDVCHGASHGQGDEDKSAAAGDPISHGQNSLEHRGLAALATDLTVYVAELTLIAKLADDRAPEARAETFVSVSPPARGPPALV